MMLNGHLEVDHTRPEMVKEVDPSVLMVDLVIRENNGQLIFDRPLLKIFSTLCQASDTNE